MSVVDMSGIKIQGERNVEMLTSTLRSTPLTVKTEFLPTEPPRFSRSPRVDSSSKSNRCKRYRTSRFSHCCGRLGNENIAVGTKSLGMGGGVGGGVENAAAKGETGLLCGF